MNQLDESWKKYEVQGIGSVRRQENYIKGASDFQNKAIEELEKYGSDINTNNKDYIEYETVLRIIKELKA